MLRGTLYCQFAIKNNTMINIRMRWKHKKPDLTPSLMQQPIVLKFIGIRKL